MIWLFITFLILGLVFIFYKKKLIAFSFIWLLIIISFYFLKIIDTSESVFVFLISSVIICIFNIKKIRLKLISQNIFQYLHQSNNNWESFKRIDTGWLASDFEKSIFQGNPQFIKTNLNNTDKVNTLSIEKDVQAILQPSKPQNPITQINKLAEIGATSLLIDSTYNGQNYSIKEVSKILKNMSKANPILAAIIGIINLDSLLSFINNFASYQQKKKFLPLFSNNKLLPFLKPTSLYETLDSQKSSIEGRIEKSIIKGKEVLGIRLSFQNIILLGTSKSNCFFLNVNIKDFNNLHGNKTHLGTAICIISNEIKGIAYNKGLKSYDNYLSYYSCTGKDIFITFSNIVNEEQGIGKGLEYLYKNQYHASSIWPLAISIPTNNTATLTSWYFAHLQKQNGRQLMSFKLVMAKLNEQFSQCLKLQLMDKLSLQNDLKPHTLKFIAILNKETYISQTIKQLGLLRGILGSNAHNIKTESKVRSFYKVAHLATELDGMNHEINQLPLIKKAALSCHPYYNTEVELLAKSNKENIIKFDAIIFKHIGYILHNLVKVWIYTLRTSFIGKLVFKRNKYKYMIKRSCSSFAFLSDITLIIWTLKIKVNTSFATHLGQCIQHIATTIVLYNHYEFEKDESTKNLIKVTIKNTLFSCQNALKNTINLALNKGPALLIKFAIFPFGKPFHAVRIFTPLKETIENICDFDKNPNDYHSKYSPFLKKIHEAKQKLKAAESAETAVTNATGTPLNTDNYEVLINRCLAAGIVSVEQSEQLRDAYMRILEIKLTNHFGNHYEK